MTLACRQIATFDKQLKQYARKSDDGESVEKARDQLKPLENFCAYLHMKSCKARLVQSGESSQSSACRRRC